jgi:glycosyltransferase involved in cell wall biosynthesis
MTKILIATDTFEQINGVSTTYKNIYACSNRKIKIIHPGLFKYKSFKAYPEIQFCFQFIKVYQEIKKYGPTHIHIATEGPIGIVARIYCKFNKLEFTSAYHTRFPEYIESYFGHFKSLAYLYLKLFHKKSKMIFVPSKSCLEDLKKIGFTKLHLWTRGVSESLIVNAPFSPKNKKRIKVLYVGRVSKEKNLPKLCELQNNFDITIVGDGPIRNDLESRYKNIQFVGYKFGRELANFYHSHDVFCFPSLTDTFGIVIIEALSNGLPVAAFNVTGPKDIVSHGIDGYLGNNLKENIELAYKLNRNKIKKQSSKKWSWEQCHDILIRGLIN